MDGIVRLVPATRELYHAFMRGYENDPDLFMDMTLFSPYTYDAGKVDRRYDKISSDPCRVNLTVMLGDEPIGDIALKSIDRTSGECTLSISLRDSSVKNKGYGTQAEKLAVVYAFETLGMKKVLADAVLKNTRSCRVLEKAGFRFVRQEGIFRYCECDK